MASTSNKTDNGYDYTTPHTPAFSWSFLHPRHAGTWFLIGLIGIGFLLPNRLRYALGGFLGDLFHNLNAKRRRIAQINIELCFPELDEFERTEMVRNHFRSFGRSVIDLGLTFWASEKRLEKLIHINGIEHVEKPIARGESVILFVPHSAGLDLGGIMISKRVPCVSMMKALRDPVLDWLMMRGRLRYKPDIWLRESGLRPLIKALRSNRVVYYMPDEDFGTRNSVFAPFFGVQTSTLTTLAGMAKRGNIDVCGCFARILPDGKGYEVDIDPPLREFPSGDDIADATAMNAALEDGLRRAPEQYMWTLRWFKTRPSGVEQPYD